MRDPRVCGTIGPLSKNEHGHNVLTLYDHVGGRVHRIPLSHARYMDNDRLAAYYHSSPPRRMPGHELARRCDEVRATWSQEETNRRTCNSSLEPVR